jgi:hypothetical protein
MRPDVAVIRLDFYARPGTCERMKHNLSSGREAARAADAVVVDRLYVAPALVRDLRPMRAVYADAN